MWSKGARLDIRIQALWGERHQSAFFNVPVFNSFAQNTYRSSQTATYRQHEAVKCRNYEHVREVEYGSFTLLVLSATGGMAPTATVAYKRMASLLAKSDISA